MTLCTRASRLATVLVIVACIFAARPAPAAAFNPIGPVCSVVGMFSGLLGKGCNIVASSPGRIISAAKALFSGKIGTAVKAILGQAGSSLRAHAGTIVGLAAIGLWVIGGAKFVLHELGHYLGETTTPRLGTSWFSATYWRMAAIGALLTLPFLFAAAIQALVRSDLTLLLRSALGYLPLAALVVAVAAPVTMLLLSGSDELSSLVSSASGQAGSNAFGLGSAFVGSLSVFSQSLFFACFFGLLTVLGATALWIELVMREAAVYVVVLMLPLAFAALVWPARRGWAIRAVELLMALILSKFVIVAVLSLGGAAMDQLGHSIATPLVGLVLVMMGAFVPWAMLRLVPLTELASATVGSLRGEAQVPLAETARSYDLARSVGQWAASATQSMSTSAEQALRLGPGGSDWIDGDATDTQPQGSDPGPNGPGGLDALGSDVDIPETVATDGQTVLDPDAALRSGLTPIVSNPAAMPESGPGAPSTDPDTSTSLDRQAQRIPGLAPMWQAANFTWRPLVLGLEENCPPSLWPPEGGADGSGASPGLVDEEAHLLPAGQDALNAASEPPSPVQSQPVKPGLPASAGAPDQPLAIGPSVRPDPPGPPDPPAPSERPAGPGAVPPPPPPSDPEPER
jgi:hypothetical protein